MDALRVVTPDVTPKATEHISEMMDLISVLLEKGHAYSVDGDVYFAINNFHQYGGLSGRNLEEMIAGARVDISPEVFREILKK